MNSNKHVFWQAFIMAFVIFWTGIMLGILFEGSRANKLENFYFNAETDIFDVQLGGEILNLFELDCKIAIRENIEFADRVYWEARNLEKYDASNKITSDILDLHKRYDLLRVLLWKNLIELDERCGNEVNVIVYLYEYDEPSLNIRAQQGTISRVLLDVKEKYGDGIILIPIAYDTKVSSLDLLRAQYGLEEFPVVLVNGKDKFIGLFSEEEIEKKLVFK